LCGCELKKIARRSVEDAEGKKIRCGDNGFANSAPGMGVRCDVGCFLLVIITGVWFGEMWTFFVSGARGEVRPGVRMVKFNVFIGGRMLSF